MAPGHVPSTFSELDAALPAAEAALVKALLTRASYGGMQGDVQMLRGYAGYWTARFSGQAEPPPAFDAAGQSHWGTGGQHGDQAQALLVAEQ